MRFKNIFLNHGFVFFAQAIKIVISCRNFSRVFITCICLCPTFFSFFRSIFIFLSFEKHTGCICTREPKRLPHDEKWPEVRIMFWAVKIGWSLIKCSLLKNVLSGYRSSQRHVVRQDTLTLGWPPQPKWQILLAGIRLRYRSANNADHLRAEWKYLVRQSLACRPDVETKLHPNKPSLVKMLEIFLIFFRN